MIVKYSNERIFWNTIGDNKPSKTYLDSLENRMTQTDIKVNFEDFYNITIVSSRKDISYIITNHNGYKQYWFYNGISKIINGGYVIKYQLDLYATYTISFLEYLKTNNINVKLNRSHKFNRSALLLKDEMLDSVPIIYNQYSDEYIPTTSTIEQPSYRRFLLNDNRNSYVEYQVSGSSIIGASGNYYYVFQDVNEDGYMWFIPVLYDDDFGANVRGIYYQLNDSYNKQLTRTQIYNTVKKLEKLRRIQDLSNKFLGCFILPNFFNYKNTGSKYDWITRNVDGQDIKFACLSIKVSGEVINNPIELDNRVNAINYNQQVLSFNYSDRLHQYALDKYDYKWCGTFIPVSLLYDTNKIKINDWMINFTQSCFVKILDNRLGLNEAILELPANLPTWNDTYNNYVNANKNQRDNQLNILKQQYNKNIFSNLFGGLLGIGGELASGDLGGSFKSLFGTGMGFANTILGYNNAISTMKAQYADAQNKMGDTINAGNIDDAIIGYYNYKFATPSHFVRHKDLTLSTIKALNNVIYLYGRYEPQIDTLTNFTIRNDFNYYLFDKQYLQYIFAQNISVDIPQEIYPYIIEQLSQGVRIWNIVPNN